MQTYFNESQRTHRILKCQPSKNFLKLSSASMGYNVYVKNERTNSSRFCRPSSVSLMSSWYTSSALLLSPVASSSSSFRKTFLQKMGSIQHTTITSQHFPGLNRSPFRHAHLLFRMPIILSITARADL